MNKSRKKHIIKHCLRYCLHRLKKHKDSGIEKVVNKEGLKELLEELERK